MPDEIGAPIEYPELRRATDARLKRIIRRDELGVLAEGPRVAEIIGSRDQRAESLAQLVDG